MACSAGFHADHSHHPGIFVLEQVAVIDKGSDGVRIAKVHADAHTRVLQHLAREIRDVDGVAQERFIHRRAVPVHQRKMQLVDVKGVQLSGAVFNDPVFDVPLPRDDVRRDLGSDRMLPVAGHRR